MCRLLLVLCLAVLLVRTASAKNSSPKEQLQIARTHCAEEGDARELLRALRLPEKRWRNAYCEVMDVNVTDDGKRELAFHLKKSTGHNQFHHLLVVFDADSKRLASLDEVASDYDVIAIEGEASIDQFYRFSENKDFAPLQYRDGRLEPVAEENEPLDDLKPKPATCPNVSSTTYSAAATQKVTDEELMPAACGNRTCVAVCPDEPTTDVYTPFSHFFGSFSAPKVMEALVGVASCDRPVGNPSYSELVLLRQTRCGWQQVTATESFNSTEEQCKRVTLQGKDVLICGTHWGPYPGANVESMVAFRMNGPKLERNAPLILEEPFRHCHDRVANWARFGDWHVEGTRVELTIDEWTTQLSKAVDEADPESDWSECDEALMADRPPEKRHHVTLLLDDKGLHLSPASAQALSKVEFRDLLKIQEQ